MTLCRSVFGTVLLLALAVPAFATSWGLGANTGLVVYKPSSGGDATTIIAWPGSVLTFMPGLRLGLRGESGNDEGYLDSGLLLLSGGGFTETHLQNSLNYQHNFGSAGRPRPYLTAGGGMILASFDSDFPGSTVVSPIFGGGVGMQFPVAEDHGSIRLELRYDRILEGESNGADIDEAGLLGLRFGFDLWMR
jgi:hypothetical protein